MKNIVILGSTGSIGTQCLDIIERLSDRFKVVGLGAHGNVDLIAEQAHKFGVTNLSVADDAEKMARLRTLVPGAKVFVGVDGMCEVATLPEADLIVMSVAGAIGIKPTQAALLAGKDIALASKEVLVATGEETMRLAKSTGAKILPIDSEHSALFQCIQGAPDKSIDKLFLTASGGPFRTKPFSEFASITPEQALKHPTWNMGGLVTINSATLMNKGLEIIEARWLFDVAVEDVEVIVHPQSIVHSMVRFKDASVIAQLGLPDMRLPIQYALVYPERPDTGLPRMDLAKIATLTFEEPDYTKFPSVRLARSASEAGGTMPAVMNGANEAAVDRFLKHNLSFLGIMETVEAVMQRHKALPATYENVLEADNWARIEAAAV